MDNRLDQLYCEWHRLGGAVLVAEPMRPISARPPEELIAESTAHCRASGRLTWVVLDWVIRHVDEIDEDVLLRRTAEVGDHAVLGVLADAAYQRNPHPKLERLMRGCAPHHELTLFFHRVAHSPLASRLTRENSLDLFRRWNFLCNELRYLEDAAEPAGIAPGARAMRPPTP